MKGNDLSIYHVLCSHHALLLSSSVCADGTWTAQRKRKEDEEEACCFLKELQVLQAPGCSAPITESEFLYVLYYLIYL